MGVAFQSGEASASGRIPEPDSVVIGPRCEVGAVRREGYSSNRAGMAFQGGKVSASGRIPESDGVVIGPGRDESAVGREGHSQKPNWCGLAV
jgi:hypothetical protein